MCIIIYINIKYKCTVWTVYKIWKKLSKLKTKIQVPQTLIYFGSRI